MFKRDINNGLVFEFDKRTGRIEALTDSDFDVIRELVFVGVDADSELLSDRLTVDCIDQRAQFICDDLVSIDIAGCPCII
jgi:hypothetical protein